jgi:3-deoxy-manno-octulosonate cytidylyltransferase (CMP-KDO synthetase)
MQHISAETHYISRKTHCISEKMCCMSGKMCCISGINPHMTGKSSLCNNFLVEIFGRIGNFPYLCSQIYNNIMTKFTAIIPARYASTRFPGKPLALLGGKPVIQHVCEKASRMLDEVYVATDDERIMRCVESFGGRAVMTRADHKSGTDRIWEAVGKTGTQADVIINIQGDEPFVEESQIKTLMNLFDNPDTQIGTLGKPFDTMEAVRNPNSPKIVTDMQGFALYFSRSVIPYVRGQEEPTWLDHFPYLKHLGIYAYRREVLRDITSLPQSPLELAESLEQLRWLQHGYRIRVGVTDVETVGIDTPEDLERAELFLKQQHNMTDDGMTVRF